MGRVRLAPINTGMYVDGESTDANAAFFGSRARSGVDICMVGNVAVSGRVVPNNSSGVMSRSRKWTQLASQIRKNGAIPGIQLSATLPDYQGQRAFAAPNRQGSILAYQSLFARMSDVDWQLLGSQFAEAIELSHFHGFDHLQIHAAHGYAFSLALDPNINPTSIGLDGLSAVLRSLASTSGRCASMRVSWFTGLPNDGERQARILQVWAPFRCSIELDLSNGYYNLDKRVIYPPRMQGEAPYVSSGQVLANRYPEASFIVAGNIWNPYRLAELSPPNLHFSLARALIADPKHLAQVQNEAPMLCDDCGGCHFFSRGQTSMSCAKWPNQSAASTT